MNMSVDASSSNQNIAAVGQTRQAAPAAPAANAAHNDVNEDPQEHNRHDTTNIPLSQVKDVPLSDMGSQFSVTG